MILGIMFSNIIINATQTFPTCVIKCIEAEGNEFEKYIVNYSSKTGVNLAHVAHLDEVENEKCLRRIGTPGI